MENSCRKRPYLIVLLIIWTLSCFQMHSKAHYVEIPVGVILDMGSSVGKTVHSCISMAVSEFYTVNNHYKTRIVLHSRDTHGEPLHALSAALDLLERPKVKVILGSQSTAEAKFLSVLGDQAEIPILSLSPLPSSIKRPYFLQITQDETTQVKAIVSMAFSFGWNTVIVIFEDNENGRDMATFMNNCLQEKSITITYISLVSTSANYEVLQEELHKLSNMQTKVYIVHASHTLASHLFKSAKYLGMMDAGYKWIVTSKTMNFLNIMDDEVIESMQGVLGFKSHIPQSRKLQKFTMKLRRKYQVMELKDINAFAISASDGVSALAMAIEKTQDMETRGPAQWGTILLNQMLETSFDGLSGNIKFYNARIAAQVLEIINVVSKEEVKVGFWTSDVSFNIKIGKMNTFPVNAMKSIVWPGGIMTNPTHRMLQAHSRRLKIGIPVQHRTGPLFDVKYDAKTNSTLVSGFCSEVFQIAFAGLKLNHSVAFEFIPVIKDGVRQGIYEDLIDQVHAGEFDAAMGDITITANRSQYVDFTLPFTDLGLATVYRNADVSLWIFMKPLSSDLWFVAVCFFIILGFVIWIFEHGTNDEFQGSPIQQIGATLWFAFSTLVFAQRQKLESNLSRFVVTMWMFVVLVLVSSYTAALSSLLTVEQIQQLSMRGSVGLEYGTPLLRNLNFDDTKVKSYKTAAELDDALSKGSKKGGVDYVILEVPYAKELIACYPSGYSMAMAADNSNGFGIVFPRGSTLTLEISTQIARLREDGTLLMLEEKWFGKQTDSRSKDSALEPKALSLKAMRGLFLMGGVSMAAALFLFTLYSIHEKVKYLYKKWIGGMLAFILLPETTIAVE